MNRILSLFPILGVFVWLVVLLKTTIQPNTDFLIFGFLASATLFSAGFLSVCSKCGRRPLVEIFKTSDEKIVSKFKAFIIHNSCSNCSKN
jgi:hypothetical protein